MRSLLPLTLFALLGGCGIDRGGAPGINTGSTGGSSTPPPIIDTVVAGPISAISAQTLTINDTTINAATAQLEVDGATSALDLLQEGQYAVVRGGTRATSGTAARVIDVATEVIGSATAFDAADNALNILGQRVVIAPTTLVDSALTAVALGDGAWLDPLRVSGFADAQGNIYATYIAPEPSAPSRLTGFATQVDEMAFRFRIGPLPVSYANASVIELPDAAPADNARVSVTGAMTGTAFRIDTIVDAPLLPAGLSDGAIIRLTAAVTRPLVDNSFALAFIDATVDADTTIADGTAADIMLGAIVALEGRWTSSQTVEVDTMRIVRLPAP